MRTILLFFSLCFAIPAGFAQDELLPLQSKGALPEMISSNLQELALQESIYPFVSGRNAHEEELGAIFRQLYNSGLVVFGDTLSGYCAAQIERLNYRNHGIPEHVQVFTVKSNYAGVFSSPEKSLFVTTGLLAQLTDPDQLTYLLLRQLVHMQLRHVISNRRFVTCKTFDERIKLLCNYGEQTERITDSMAAVIYVSRGFPKLQIPVCIDVLAYSGQPFEDLPVPADYFSSSLMYVPESLFDVRERPGTLTGKNPYGISGSAIALQKRKQLLIQQLSRLASPASAAGDSPEFRFIRNVARLQNVHDHIVHHEYARALYSIFILEKTTGNSGYLRRMKAHAWLGLVNQSYGREPNRAKTPDLSQMPRESARFFNVLHLMPPAMKATFALRIITDEIATAPAAEREELLAVRSTIVSLLAGNERFPVDQFSRTPYDREVKQIVQPADTSGNKYEKLDAATKVTEIPVVDSTQFYFYALSDLVNDPAFMSSFHKELLPDRAVPREIMLVNPGVNLFDTYGNRTEISTKRKTALAADLPQLEELTGTGLTLSNYQYPNLPATTDSYNERAIYLSVFDQLYHVNGYRSPILPLDYSQIRGLQAVYDKELLGIALFENQYSLYPKGYHLIALMVAPLPFAISDLFIGGNHSQFTMLYLNTASGSIEAIQRESFRDPLTKRLIKGRLYKSIMQFNSSPQ